MKEHKDVLASEQYRDELLQQTNTLLLQLVGFEKGMIRWTLR